jgi:ATP-dependent Lon protease
MPAANKKDLHEIPKKVIRDIEFIYVEDVRDVFKHAMTEPFGKAPKGGAITSGTKKGKKKSKGA